MEAMQRWRAVIGVNRVRLNKKVLQSGARWVTIPPIEARGGPDAGGPQRQGLTRGQARITRQAGTDSRSSQGSNVVFTGTYEHTIDAKNRLAIPSRIRSLLQREAAAAGGGDPGNILLYVVLAKNNVLCLYTEREFERRAMELEHSERHPDEILEYEELRFSLAEAVELDAAGRIRLPDNLLKMAGLGPEVVLMGVKDHLQIRDRKAWYAQRDHLLRTRPQMLMNPRQAMRRPAEPSGDSTPIRVEHEAPRGQG